VVFATVCTSISQIAFLAVLSIFGASVTIYFAILLVAELVLLTGSCLVVLISLAWDAVLIKCAACEGVEAPVFLLSSLGNRSVVWVVISGIVVFTSVVVVSISVHVVLLFQLVLDEGLVLNSHGWTFAKSTSGASPLFLRAVRLLFFNYFCLLSI